MDYVVTVFPSAGGSDIPIVPDPFAMKANILDIDEREVDNPKVDHGKSSSSGCGKRIIGYFPSWGTTKFSHY